MYRPLTRPLMPDERGAVAIVVAMSMTALLIITAMVLDFGLLRVDRQIDRSAADAATLAGLHALDAADGKAQPYAGVCNAIRYLKANSDRFSGINESTGWSNGLNGCTDAMLRTKVCKPTDRSTWASWHWAGTSQGLDLDVTIESGYDLGAHPWQEDSLPATSGDNGGAAYAGCDQLAVTISQSRRPGLGSLATSSDLETEIRSVGRVHLLPPKSPFALLLLERFDCQALANTSIGRIDVSGYKSNPGLIHADSNGTGDGCGSRPVIVGAQAQGIVAHEAPDTNEPGEISTVATTNRSDGIPKVYAGPLPGLDTVSSDLMTREVLDNVYLDGVQSAVNAAKPYLTATTAPAGFTTRPCPTGSATTWNDTRVFINCSNMNNNLTLPNATDVIFTGQVSASIVSMPKAARVYVAGVLSPLKGITVGTTFEMNNVTAGAACPTTWNPSRQRAQLFVYRGDLAANGGTFRACNTTVMLMGSDINACLPTTTPTYFDDGKVCPGPSSGSGLLNLGGNSTIDWTAPDLVDDEVKADSTALSQLEDLALWTETYGTHTLGGSGTMHLLGVFAAPNAHPIKLNGNPSQNVRNSQYIARSLQTTGSGTLQLTPLPSMPVAPPTATLELVR